MIPTHQGRAEILGLRMALYGVKLLGIADPAGADRKRLVTFAEIDRCATDAIPIVTKCGLGKRALKFRDFGKVAETFCDLHTGRYREMADADLFEIQWVRVSIGLEDLPGSKAPRVICSQCGEGISFNREVVHDGRLLCRACAGERHYEAL
jgi:formylmethanofuran dehydrogenase subunit E